MHHSIPHAAAAATEASEYRRWHAAAATLYYYTLLGPLLLQRCRELAAARVDVNPAAHARRRADPKLVL